LLAAYPKPAYPGKNPYLTIQSWKFIRFTIKNSFSF
jgi:hypothetical protein